MLQRGHELSCAVAVLEMEGYLRTQIEITAVSLELVDALEPLYMRLHGIQETVSSTAVTVLKGSSSTHRTPFPSFAFLLQNLL